MTDKVYEKVDEAVLKEIIVEEKVQLWDYDYLKVKRQAVLDQLAAVDLLISEAEKLGIKSKYDVKSEEPVLGVLEI